MRKTEKKGNAINTNRRRNKKKKNNIEETKTRPYDREDEIHLIRLDCCKIINNIKSINNNNKQ